MRAVLVVMLAAAAVTAAAWLAFLAWQRELERQLAAEAEEYLRVEALAWGDGS